MFLQVFCWLVSSKEHCTRHKKVSFAFVGILKVMKYEQQIAATCNAKLLRCKLKSVVACITTHLKHCHATKSVVASWKKWTPVQLAATCCIYQWTGWLFFNIFIFKKHIANSCGVIPNLVTWHHSNLTVPQCYKNVSNSLGEIIEDDIVLPKSDDFELLNHPTCQPGFM